MTPHTNIIYVNFSPYENAGNILTYLQDHFTTVLSFTFNFHKISEDHHQSHLCIYEKKKIVYECRLFQTPTNAPVAFILLPVRSLVIFAQLLFHLIRLQKTYGPYTTYFTVNAFTAWSGNILRSLGIVKKTIFWVWDYYPPIHDSFIVRFMRFLYWQFDIPATKQTDHVVFMNKRLADLRKNLGILPKNISYPVVGIGTNPISKPYHKSTHPIALAFIGVLKRSQGLDIVYKSANSLIKRYPGITLHVIGGGPDMDYFRKLSTTSPLPTTFYGYVKNDSKIDGILKECHIGIAPYIADKDNVAYYTDPSKIKRYIEVGLPVITTNVFDFSKEITKNSAGVVISYDADEFVDAVGLLMSDYPHFQEQALLLAKRCEYKTNYKTLFPV